MNSHTPAVVNGDIFDYPKLIEKLDREIKRLINAQSNSDETGAIDHAINAAFTAFHLLEWKAKDNDPQNKDSARTLLENIKSDDLNLLHDIVTRTKHVTVSNRAHPTDIEVLASAHYDTTSSSTPTFDSFTIRQTLHVKFGDKRATDVLTNVLSSHR